MQNEVVGNNQASSVWRNGGGAHPCWPVSLFQGRQVGCEQGTSGGSLRTGGESPLTPKSLPLSSSPSKSPGQSGHHCGTATTAQSRNSPELCGMALSSLPWSFMCNPEADRYYSSILQGRKSRFREEKCLGQRLSVQWQRGASTQISCQTPLPCL